MRFQSNFVDIYIPDSLLELRKTPSATIFLTFSYVTLSISLLLARFTFIGTHQSSDLDHRLIVSPVVQLLPNKVLSYPFSLLFSNLVDVELWKFVVNFINLYVGGRFIETFWQSPNELYKFVLGVGTVTNLIVVILAHACSYIFPGLRLDLPLDGSYTVLIGFPIIYKQLFPETTLFEVKNVPFISKNFRFKLLPIFMLCFLTFVQILFHHFSELLSIWTTFFSCWTYLRFYQILPVAIVQNSEFTIVGDASETFKLIYFFPDLIKPILAPVFDFCYDKLVVKLHLAKPFAESDIEHANSLVERRVANGVANSNPEERRKWRALQVLEERMVDSEETTY